MSNAFEGIIIESAPKQIARRIKEAILDGKVKVDERLPTEEELASQFSVSRATIREALKRLAAENLVESRRGAAGGNFVKAPSREDIKNNIAASITVAVSLNQFTFEQVIGCRYQMGLMCCRLAAMMRTEDDLEVMRREVDYQRSASITDVDFCASDVRYHCRMAIATGNPLLASSVSGILEGLEPIMNFLLFRFRDRKIIADQHARLVDFLASRDADSAAAMLREQVEYLTEKQRDAQHWRDQKDRSDRKAPPPHAGRPDTR